MSDYEIRMLSRGLGNSMASFIAEIDANSVDVAAYIAQRLLPLFKLSHERLITGEHVASVLRQIGSDGRKLVREECVAPQDEKPKLSVDQVIAELKRLRSHGWDMKDRERIRELIDQLPEPPKPDVIEDCILTARAELGHTMEGDKLITIAQRNFAKGVISRYLEIRGLPADPELEGR